MGSVIDVAKWFLQKEPMTHKKLQKLCYYAQAWHLALLDKPLFHEEIQAWIHGPVIPALYRNFAGCGWRKIPKTDGTDVQFDAQTEEVLEAVFVTYGEFSGDQLERLTHSELPWIEARGNLQPYEPCENIISLKSMADYYAKKYEEFQGD